MIAHYSSDLHFTIDNEIEDYFQEYIGNFVFLFKYHSQVP